MRHYIKSLNLICVVKQKQTNTQEKKEKYSGRLYKTKKRKGEKKTIFFSFVKAGLEGQTDLDQDDILWKASSVSVKISPKGFGIQWLDLPLIWVLIKLVVTVLQQYPLQDNVSYIE